MENNNTAEDINNTAKEDKQTEMIELTPELKAKLEQIKVDNENRVNKKDKKIGPLIAAVVVLLLISAAAIAFTITKKDNSPSTTEPSPSEEKPKNLEITENAKKSIYEKIALLNYRELEVSEMNDFIKNGDMKSASFLFTYLPELYKNGYNSEQKLYTILYRLYFNEKVFETVTSEVYNEKNAKKLYNRWIDNYDNFVLNVKMLSGDYVADRYVEVYGERLAHMDADGICGGFNYDSETGYYLNGLNGGCGGVDFRTVQIHVNEITSDTENYYVDMNAVTVYTGENASNNKAQCRVYSDVTEVYDKDGVTDKNAKVYKDCEMNDKYETTFKLTDADKDKVAKYRYTFDKEFHFTGIKKLD